MLACQEGMGHGQEGERGRTAARGEPRHRDTARCANALSAIDRPQGQQQLFVTLSIQAVNRLALGKICVCVGLKIIHSSQVKRRYY